MPMLDQSALRRRRVQLRLTQAELAAAAGVSRQLVAAVEAGVNMPSVDAGLRLARALGCSAEELFEAVPEARRGARTAAHRAGNAEQGVLVVAGCDPALAVAEALLAEAGSIQILALDATSGTAIESLRGGGIHAAVVHGPTDRLRRPPVDVIRLQLAHWQVGLGLARALKARTAADCFEQGVPIVQRAESAASQQALRRVAIALGQGLPGGAVASGHLGAARAAAALGGAAITTEGAASRIGLAFVPLELHTVELWLDRRWQAHAGAEALGNLLTSHTFAASVNRLGGYDLSGCGTALPAMAPI